MNANNNPTLVELADLWLVKYFQTTTSIVAYPIGTYAEGFRD